MTIKRKDPGAEERGTSGVGGAVSAGGSRPAGGVGSSRVRDDSPDLGDVTSQPRQSESHGPGKQQQAGKPNPDRISDHKPGTPRR